MDAITTTRPSRSAKCSSNHTCLDHYGLDNPPLTPGFEAFLRRVALNDDVFDHADSAALRVLTEQYLVRFLLIDRVHHNADPALLPLGRIVFSDQDATILAVT